MATAKLRGRDLKKIQYMTDRSKSLAIDIMARHFKHMSKPLKLALLEKIKDKPEEYVDDEILRPIAEEFIEDDGTSHEADIHQLEEEVPDYRIYGRRFIDSNTVHQMDLAMRLPVTAKGALMPDAHVGYGIPVGGVLATRNAVIPYGVGLDIGCRMSLTIYDAPEEFISRHRHRIKMALKEETYFGIGQKQREDVDHAILDRAEFAETDLLRRLHGKARAQLGTSGSGNHFVEVGVVELDVDNPFGFDVGRYVGLLAHSGSRGFGATIAQYYTRVAMDTCYLPKGAHHMAWLDMDSEAGQEYWRAMDLAGDYAQACHDVIHQKVAQAIGLKRGVKVENHHNFAWKEIHDGEELIVHRKGSTPAAKGELGIIPATMAAPGYIVMGKGVDDSLRSVSHGAGRKMSRGKAKNSISRSEMNKQLKGLGITLIGGGVDESPFAYKDIEQVMAGQTELVDIIGSFTPRIVRMDKP